MQASNTPYGSIIRLAAKSMQVVVCTLRLNTRFEFVRMTFLSISQLKPHGRKAGRNSDVLDLVETRGRIILPDQFLA